MPPPNASNPWSLFLLSLHTCVCMNKYIYGKIELGVDTIRIDNFPLGDDKYAESTNLLRVQTFEVRRDVHFIWILRSWALIWATPSVGSPYNDTEKGSFALSKCPHLASTSTPSLALEPTFFGILVSTEVPPCGLSNYWILFIASPCWISCTAPFKSFQ